MSLPAVIIALIAIILLIVGGLIESLKFLLWVAIFLFLISIITYLLRSIRGRR